MLSSEFISATEKQALVLSIIYNKNSFYIIAYQDGHGCIELCDKTFPTKNGAEAWVEQNKHDYLNEWLEIIKVHL